MRGLNRGWQQSIGSEDGFTLLEALAALALTAAVSAVVTSLILAMLAHKRALQEQTDLHDSLRTPAAMILNDVRYAAKVECDWNFLRLTLGTYEIKYMFMDINPDDPFPPAELHRIEGGVDTIVGRNLQPPIPPDSIWYGVFPDWPQTHFACAWDATNLSGKADVHLVLAPTGGQKQGTELDVTILKR